MLEVLVCDQLIGCAVCEQVIHNWTIPLHGERSDQMLMTKTFEMVSRYSHLCIIYSFRQLCMKLLERVRDFFAEENKGKPFYFFLMSDLNPLCPQCFELNTVTT